MQEIVDIFAYLQVTYTNECRLLEVACRREGNDLTLAYHGPCRSKDEKTEKEETEKAEQETEGEKEQVEVKVVNDVKNAEESSGGNKKTPRLYPYDSDTTVYYTLFDFRSKPTSPRR